MDMKFTFEDGSSAYLAHYGVIGMKWGVRNEKTEAHYSDKRMERYRKKRDRYIKKGDATNKEYKAFNESVPYVYKNGHKSYARSKDSRKSWRYFNKQARNNKKIYELDAKAAGLKPDKTYSENIKIGWSTLNEGLKDTQRRARRAGKKEVDKILSR